MIALSYHVQKRLFGKNKWLDDLRPMIADTSLTDPDLDFADFAKGGLDLRDAGRRPRRQPAAQPRLLDRLLQQGTVRREGRRVPEDLRRDDRRRGEAQRSRQGRLRLRRARPEERQRAGLDELPAGLRRRCSSTTRAS